jgi:hypothetical protein
MITNILAIILFSIGESKSYFTKTFDYSTLLNAFTFNSSLLQTTLSISTQCLRTSVLVSPTRVIFLFAKAFHFSYFVRHFSVNENYVRQGK